MEDNAKDKEKIKYLSEKESLLEDFCIKVTQEISMRLDELYPNDVAIENYTRKLIVDRLSDKEGY